MSEVDEERDAEWRAATDRERVLIAERDALRREVEALEAIIEDHDWGDQ